MSRIVLVAWSACLALCSSVDSAHAQAATRLDLARAYVRFEQALLAHEPVGERLAAASLALDQATARFFLGDAAAAIGALDRATLDLGPEGLERGAARAWLAARLELEPEHGLVGGQAGPALVFEPLYDIEEAAEDAEPPVDVARSGAPPARALLVDGDGEVLFALDAPRPGSAPVRLGDALELPTPRTLYVELRDAAGRVIQRLPWPVLRADPAARAAELRAELAALRRTAAPSAARALETFANRIGLLDPRAEAGAGARLASDLARLEADLVRELAELRAGSDPYRGRPGALWRVARLLGVEVPLWTIAPPRAPGAPAPPLVIALHGAGGEESQWIEAYGRGALVALARERGCLLVLPRTYALTGRPDLFAELLLDVAQDQLFDPTRVLVIGHSMGAAAAADLANRRPDLLRGVALLAGGANLLPSPTLPRTLVALGTLDRIVPPAPARRAALAAGAELLEFEHHGHTTFVPLALPAAFDLLER